jgi:hypothetical protein
MLGLVIGSMVPDIGYALRQFNWNKFSHSMLGSIVFCLPVGLLAAWVIFLIRRPLAQSLPAPHRQALVPSCGDHFPPLGRLLLSLFIGAWTHIALDAVTHESALLAENQPALRGAFSAVEQRGLEIYQALWILVSSAGLGLLGLLYLVFLKRRTGGIRFFSPGELKPTLIWLGLLGIPYLFVIPSAYHLFGPAAVRLDRRAVYGSLQPYLMLLVVELTVFGFLLRIRAARDSRSRPV